MRWVYGDQGPGRVQVAAEEEEKTFISRSRRRQKPGVEEVLEPIQGKICRCLGC